MKIIKYKILIDIHNDTIYDMIVDIFECINEEYIHNIYGNYMSYITIYNNIIICLEDDTDYNYSNLIFTYVLKSRLLYRGKPL